MKRLFTDTGRILCIYRSGAIHEVMRNSYEFSSGIVKVIERCIVNRGGRVMKIFFSNNCIVFVEGYDVKWTEGNHSGLL